MKFSIIIPAHNEECFISRCLDSIEKASVPYRSQVETIVVLNRCTDSTEKIVRDWGAKTLINEDKNLAKIRNAGAKTATGEILVTIDADSWMTDNMLVEIDRLLQSGKYIGGGVPILPERMSTGILFSIALLKFYILLSGLAGGLYWCYRRDFEAIGGFNENLLVGEDLDFAKRLRAYGRAHGKKFTTMSKASITTSCRKFDHFGDWFIFKQMLFNHREIMECAKGKDATFANRCFYDFEHPRKQG
ncbi:MAG: glycosyl transferase family 2 [Lentisphaerae bacterium RIFOXYA12_FULL_48_11]|nr:MAG: glycosyl transferase family 2 [Lentisphaerae bacterium RIFOXYA12_FULL_48_11]